MTRADAADPATGTPPDAGRRTRPASGRAGPADAVAHDPRPDALRDGHLGRATYRRDASFLNADPLAVVLPRTVDQTAAVLRACRDHGIPFTPRAAGTGLAGGATPTGEGGRAAARRQRGADGPPARPRRRQPPCLGRGRPRQRPARTGRRATRAAVRARSREPDRGDPRRQRRHQRRRHPRADLRRDEPARPGGGDARRRRRGAPAGRPDARTGGPGPARRLGRRRGHARHRRRRRACGCCRCHRRSARCWSASPRWPQRPRRSATS